MHRLLLLLVAVAACERARCPDDMVPVSGGTVVVGFGMPRHAWMEAERSVHLNGYCIDRYELPNEKGAVPLANLSWSEARAACAKVGKRLCTAAEWERACRGPSGWRQSYGAQRDPTACNTPIDGSGPGVNDAPIAASGSHPRCKSAEGAFDMNGNLSEWVADPWTGPPEPFNTDATVDGTWHTVRGGTMWNRTFYGQDCASRHGHGDGVRFQDDGARCCRDGA